MARHLPSQNSPLFKPGRYRRDPNVSIAGLGRWRASGFASFFWMQQPSSVFIPGCLSQGLTFVTQRDFIYDPALLEISLCGVTFVERTSEVLANFSADMIVHTRRFLFGL